jgi:hypothetical protein
MTKSLKDRFREVDRVPTPWDTSGGGARTIPSPSSTSRVRTIVLAAASLAVAGAVAVVAIVGADGAGRTPAPDASWLVSTEQGRCVEQYSADTLPNRDYAFEGVVAAVDPPANSDPDPGGSATTVTFDVQRWFWGGTEDRVSLKTYAVPPVSTEAVEASIGAHVLVSGDAEFFWSCGFTKPFSEGAAGEFEAAAAGIAR